MFVAIVASGITVDSFLYCVMQACSVKALQAEIFVKSMLLSSCKSRTYQLLRYADLVLQSPQNPSFLAKILAYRQYINKNQVIESNSFFLPFAKILSYIGSSFCGRFKMRPYA